MTTLPQPLGLRGLRVLYLNIYSVMDSFNGAHEMNPSCCQLVELLWIFDGRWFSWPEMVVLQIASPGIEEWSWSWAARMADMGILIEIKPQYGMHTWHLRTLFLSPIYWHPKTLTRTTLAK